MSERIPADHDDRRHAGGGRLFAFQAEDLVQLGMMQRPGVESFIRGVLDVTPERRQTCEPVFFVY
jgi:hypothetical protein